MDTNALKRAAARVVAWCNRCIAYIGGRARPVLRAQLLWLLRQRRAHRSLVGRLLTLLLAGIIGIYVVAIAGLWWSGGNLMSDALRKQAVQWLVELDRLGTPLYVGGAATHDIQALAEKLRRSPEVGFVRYYDAGGTRVLGEYKNRIVPPVLSASERQRAAAAAASTQPYVFSDDGGEPGTVRIVAPVRIGSFATDGLFGLDMGAARESVKVIGYIDFGLDPGYHRADFRRSMLAGSIAIALVFVAMYVVGRRLIKRALAPLLALQEPLARVARGETEIRVGSGGDREIAAVSHALNTILTALRQREQALEHAERDAVTGVSNRAYFLRQLEQERERVLRDRCSAAVITIVVDRYVSVREELGRAAADRLLGQTAALLRAHIRGDDVIARHGTDRFAVLVRNVNRDRAVKVASAMARVVEEFQFVDGERAYHIRAHMGVATFDSDRLDAEGILAQADAAGVQARASGGGGIGVHRLEEGDELRRTNPVGWSQYIRDAIHDNRFRLVYQPIVSLRGRDQPERYEVLLRLATEGGEFVTPGAFLPIANRSGLLVDVDYWVIREAFAALARFRAEGRDVHFFINLSGQAFEDGEKLLKVIDEQLHRCKVPGSAVVFEITEQVAVRQLERARVVVEGVHALQCRFALDDFGSGFSSLSYLKHLPVSFIKMSGAFMQNMATATTDEIVVKSIIQIAQTLGKQTIAESVQDRATLRLLTTLGADFAQGYFIGRPTETLPLRTLKALVLPDGTRSERA